MQRNTSDLKEAALSYAVAKAIGSISVDDSTGARTTTYADQVMTVGQDFHPAMNEAQAVEIADSLGVTVTATDGEPPGWSARLGSVTETHQVKSYAICRAVAKAALGEIVDVPPL
jgi:hypothetical protein